MAKKRKSSIETEIGNRKATRKAERQAKKHKKRQQVLVQPTETNFEKVSKFKSAAPPSILKKNSKYSTQTTTTNTKKIKQKQNSLSDKYSNVDTSLAAALRRDDEEIEYLQSKLFTKDKGKKRLNNEYSKLEGYGDDFGDFLEGLDEMTSSLLAGNSSSSKFEEANNGSDSDASDYNREKQKFDKMFGEDGGDSDGEDDDLDDKIASLQRKYGSGDDSDSDESSAPSLVVHDPINNGGKMDEKDSDDDIDNSDSDSEEVEEADSDDDDDDDDDDVDSQSDASGSASSRSEGVDDRYENDSDTSGEDNSNVGVAPDHDAADVYRPTAGEDIYGNPIQASNTVATKKYVPPHLRKSSSELKSSNGLNDIEDEDVEISPQLLRSINGIMNRMSAGTLDSVCSSVIKLFDEYPRNQVTKSLVDAVCKQCVHETQVMDLIIPVVGTLLSAVHLGVGNSFSGYVVERFVTSFLMHHNKARQDNATLNDHGDEIGAYSKTSANYMLLLCYLYNLQVVYCTLMYDIIKDLINSFKEADVEVLLMILKHSGFQLRQDDPTSLKDIVLLVQERAVEASKTNNERQKDQPESSRVAYMIEAITDLKNNRKSRKQEALGEELSKFRKLIGRVKVQLNSSTGRLLTESCLRITLNDIKNIEEKGRWWKTGASWVGNQYNSQSSVPSKRSQSDKDEEDALIKLALKNNMNTDLRRSIFCVLMGSSDCDDAFEKLVKLGLKGKQDREIVRVLVHCCGQEKIYNPFYEHLASRICDFQSIQKFTFRLAFWDYFKQFESLKQRKLANLGKLLAALIRNNILSLTVLKPIDVASADQNGLLFLAGVFSTLFDEIDPILTTTLFSRCISDSEDGETLKQNLTLFFIQYLKDSPKNQKRSHFRSNYKAAMKILEKEDLELTTSME